MSGRRGSVAERFWAKVDRGETCWTWIGARSDTGYGSFCLATGRIVAAHRLAYELSVGPIPPGLQIDHLCRNKACVNPAHLEPVTPKENSQRANARTHCKHGHDLSDAYEFVCKGGRVRRFCRPCLRRRTAEGQRRLRERAREANR